MTRCAPLGKLEDYYQPDVERVVKANPRDDGVLTWPHEFRFPDVGEGITEGELLSWKVREGDVIAEDQTLAEVETDKAVVEILLQSREDPEAACPGGRDHQGGSGAGDH